jgi:hypothetical protein
LPLSFGCDTDSINGGLTLDNSKFIFLSFIYEFMYMCLDMERIHYSEGDTDSMFLSITGFPEEDKHQAFKLIILDDINGFLILFITLPLRNQLLIIN